MFPENFLSAPPASPQCLLNICHVNFISTLLGINSIMLIGEVKALTYINIIPFHIY